MGILSTIFYEPVYNLFIFFSGLFEGQAWFGIVITVLIVRFILLPISLKLISMQSKMSVVKPKLDAIKAKYKDDKNTQAIKTIEVYKQHKLRPFSTVFLFIFVQIPFFISMFFVFKSLPEIDTTLFYSFVEFSKEMIFGFAGIDLLERSVIIALIAGIIQYFIFSISQKRTKNNQGGEIAQMIQKQMKYFLPIMVVGFSYFLGAAVALYWATSNIFSVLQEIILYKKLKK